jgi:RimJ/RimL family protein N-acetyltransferase/ABC-type transporter Mla MlaB component
METLGNTHPRFAALWQRLLANHANPTALITQRYLRYLEQGLARRLERQIAFVVAENDIPILGGKFDVLRGPLGEIFLEATDAPSALIHGRCEAPALRRTAEDFYRRYLSKMLEEIRPAHLRLVDQLVDGSISFLTRWALDRDATLETDFNQVVDLTRDEALLWQDLTKTCQWAVNWGRKNLRLGILEAETAAGAFRELRRLHVAAASGSMPSDATWAAQEQMITEGEAFVVTGSLDDKVVSAAFFQRSMSYCSYGVSASDRSLVDKPTGHALLWTAMRHAKKLGDACFSLGSQVWSNAGEMSRAVSPKEINVSRFKRGFGGRALPQLIVTLVPLPKMQIIDDEPRDLEVVLGAALSRPEWSVGEKVILRPLTIADVTPRYLEWFADDLVTEFLDARNLTREDVKSHIHRGLAENDYFMCAICDRESGLHVGNVKIGPIRWRHASADMVTVIGDRRFWGRGFATEAIGMAMALAFKVLGIRRLHAAIHRDNVGSLNAYTRAGWMVEGTFRQHSVRSGVAGDVVLICAFNPGAGS